MSTIASRSESLADQISDLEEGVRNMVSWGQVLRTMGASATSLETSEVYVVGLAVLDLALEIEKRWERCFDLSRKVERVVR